MKCEICTRDQNSQKKICSRSCKYKKNVFLWVLRYLKDHGTFKTAHDYIEMVEAE